MKKNMATPMLLLLFLYQEDDLFHDKSCWLGNERTKHEGFGSWFCGKKSRRNKCVVEETQHGVMLEM